MNRHFRGVRQYQHALRHFAWFNVDTKKLALASTVTALVISSGITLLTSTDTPAGQKPRTVTPSTNTTSSHPLLDSYSGSSLPGLQESQASQQQSSGQSSQNSALDPVTSGIMHQTTVTINGESIEIPPSGTSHQAIKNQDGSRTDVNIQHEQTQVDGTSRSNIIIDSRLTANNPPASLNSRITITH